MKQVIILGSAAAVPTREQENTHLLILAKERTILVDCPGNPLVRITESGVDPQSVTDIILTHFHPDHVSGFASFLMGLWLMGRKQPMKVYGLEPTISRAKKMMEMYEWGNWPNFYPVDFVVIPSQPLAPVLVDDAVQVIASPVAHMIPTIGLRIDFLDCGKSVAYSCDTEPSPLVVQLAQDADVLIHEATGKGLGHTSPEQAGEVASQAGVGRLYLIHYPPQISDKSQLVVEASRTFSGPVMIAKDFDRITIEE
jgi:ribonuclease Z